jgi:hypothetical protein
MSSLSQQPYEVQIPDFYLGGNDPVNDILDVIVKFAGGQRWVGSFITFDRALSDMKDGKETGEYANGTYFWISDMILIERVVPELIHAAIRDLLDRECFEQAFLFCDPASDDDFEIYDPPLRIPLTEEGKKAWAESSSPPDQGEGDG